MIRTPLLVKEGEGEVVITGFAPNKNPDLSPTNLPLQKGGIKPSRLSRASRFFRFPTFRARLAFLARPAFFSPHPSTVGKTDIGAVADHQMVQDTDAKEVACGDEPGRQFAVFRTGLGIATGVIVKKNNSRGGLPDGKIEHLARVHDAHGQAALGHRTLPDDGVFRIQKDDFKHFVPEIAKQGVKVMEEILAASDSGSCAKRNGKSAFAEFQSSHDLRGLGWTNPRDLAELLKSSIRQAVKPTQLLKKISRHVHGRRPLTSHPQQDGKQFRVGQPIRTRLKETLTRTFMFRPLVNPASLRCFRHPCLLFI
jgi:hypothetical protein